MIPAPSKPLTALPQPEALPRLRKRRISEARPAWHAQAPAVHALSPLGHLHMQRLFKILPTHPDSKRLDAVLTGWAMRSGIFEQDAAKEVAELWPGHLAYWLAPTASAPVAELIGSYCLWIIAVDDAIIERGVPLDDLIRTCDDLLRKGHTTLPITAVSRYFLELRQAVIALGAADLLPQIADDHLLCMMANQVEQRYLQEDTLPSVSEYLKLRTRTTIWRGVFQVRRCDKGYLPPHLRFCERLERIADLTSVVTAIYSDIVGYRKDLEMDFPMNIIAVISLDWSVDLATAYLISLELLELLKHTFDALVEELCADPGPHPETATMARALAVWPDGFHTWHQNRPRYRTDRTPHPVYLGERSDWRSGPLFRAVLEHATGLGAPPAPLGVSGPGTSALRVTSSLNAADLLKDWLEHSLGSGFVPAEPAKSPPEAAPSLPTSGGPNEPPAAAAQPPMSAALQPAAPQPTNATPDAPALAAAAAPWPALKPTGPGTSAARLEFMLNPTGSKKP